MTVFLPEEVKQVVRSLDIEDIKRRQNFNKEIYDYAIASTKIYGEITYEDLFFLYEKYNQNSDLNVN